MRLISALATAMLLSISIAPVRAAGPPDCETARCSTAVGDELAKCGCPDAQNHGRYVSCVAHAMKKLAKNGDIPKNCKGKIQRCAARSICGKPGFTTCQVPDDVGPCETPCTADATTTCCADATTTCDPAIGCIISTKCKIKSSEDRCTAIPGAVLGTATNCCTDCPSAP